MFDSRLARAVVLGAVAWLTAAPAHATPLFDFQAPASVVAPPQRDTFGFIFAVSAAVTVDGFGFFDVGSDGLASAHEVALWDSAANPIGSAIVNPGTPTAGADISISGLGRYIYKDVPDLVLGPGTYVLGANYGPGNMDPLIQAAAAVIPGDPAATFAGGRLGPDPAGVNAVFPILPVGGNQFFGPNLRIAGSGPPAGISEPLTVALLLLGLAGIALTLGRVAHARRRLVPPRTLHA